MLAVDESTFGSNFSLKTRVFTKSFHADWWKVSPTRPLIGSGAFPAPVILFECAVSFLSRYYVLYIFPPFFSYFYRFFRCYDSVTLSRIKAYKYSATMAILSLLLSQKKIIKTKRPVSLFSPFWAAAPKGPMTYAFTYAEISPSSPTSVRTPLSFEANILVLRPKF